MVGKDVDNFEKVIKIFQSNLKITKTKNKRYCLSADLTVYYNFIKSEDSGE